jgi:hypothetical protein
MFENAQQAEAFGKAFAQAYSATQGVGYKAPVGTPATTGWTHGVGGIFGVPGLDRDVISARITPRGISRALRVIPSVYAFPEFAYVTGVADDGDTEPSNVCSTCPSATMQGCIQSACFGRICRETRELTISRAIERLNRGDLDLSLVNDMIGGDGVDPFMAFRNLDRNRLLQVATMQAMMEVGISMQQSLSQMIWQGNPANNVGTGYNEFNGLDILISTGKVDYHTGTTCPALDSDVKNFNYKLVNVVQQGNFTIVRDLEYLEAYLYHNADRMNLLPVDWAIVMRPELWYELSMIWPVAWMSTRNITWPAGAANAIGQQVYNIDATRVREMVQEMQAGMFMYINGRRHSVILDDGILEYNSLNDANLAAGEFASNIYFVPLTFLGGRPGTYLQHKDYRAGMTDIALSRSQDFYWSDAGRFQWTVERVKYCYTLSAQVEPRIVLKVPQLAGRLNLVRYIPRQHFRDPWDDSDYFYKGGVESRTMSRVYPDNARSEGVVPTDGHCQE